jgi:hypothetical protein
MNLRNRNILNLTRLHQYHIHSRGYIIFTKPICIDPNKDRVGNIRTIKCANNHVYTDAMKRESNTKRKTKILNFSLTNE